MTIAVWDSYVQRDNGSIMHFDILVPSTLTTAQEVFNFGYDYLKGKAFKTGELSSSACRFCHVEQGTEMMIATIKQQGYAIIELENCS